MAVDEVSACGEHARAAGGQLAGEVVGTGCVTRVRQCHGCARARQPASDRSADPAARPGYECYATGQHVRGH
jgi:hypothetical protein